MKSTKKCGKCECLHTRKGPRRFQAYCTECHAAYMRATRPKYSELNAEQKRKGNARSYANTYQRRGLLQKKPCIKCGAKNTQKHHSDYSKPLDVHWMCRKCHLRLHQAERKEA